MSMNKHGNTFVQGDRVRRSGTEGKVAEDSGIIVGADPAAERFGVRWANGETTWHKLAELESA